MITSESIRASERKRDLFINPNGRELYSIVAVDGKFEVSLPGLIDSSNGSIVGTCQERFEDEATARARVEISKNDVRIATERASLDKTYAGDHFFNIKLEADGRYKVTVPGGIDETGRYYLATTSFIFDTWDEAKAYFLTTVEAEERVIDHPLLRLQPSPDNTIAFSELKSFHPQVAAAEQAHPIPASVEKYLMSDGRLDGTAPSAKTYQETIKERGWEKKLYNFIIKYIKGEGAEIAKGLGIKELDALSPSQAVELATSLVVDLTKYKWSDTKAERGDLVVGQDTVADQSTVLQLLQEGLQRRTDPTWEGNGVCRNFASAVKGVFEALKANQTQYNRLRNTYALFEQGDDSFAPERDDYLSHNLNKVGHAWNSFVTVTRDGSANSVITDATWAKRDLDTKKIIGLDHTLLRMEPVVRAVALDMPLTAPHHSEQLKDILEYYMVKIDGSNEAPAELPPVTSLSVAEQDYYRSLAIQQFGTTYDLSQVEDNRIIAIGQQFSANIIHEQTRAKERVFFTSKVVELMRQHGVPAELPDGLAAAINEQYQTIADKADHTEIEIVYQIAQRDPIINFQKIIRSYLRSASLSDYHVDKFIFKDNTLQKQVYEELKGRSEFDRLLKDSPKFRTRLREVLPALLIDFSPDIKPEDAAELRYLVQRSSGLRHLERMIRPGKSSTIIEKAREILRKLNADNYEAMTAALDDYTIIKRFDELHSALRTKRQ